MDGEQGKYTVATAYPGGGQGPFDRFAPRDAADLIADYPLAWIVPEAAGAAAPSLLPLLARTDAVGNVIGLVGHMSRRSPLRAALEANPRALLLFTGPQAFVSTACVSDPAWAPTWNYAQLRVEAEVRFATGHADAALAALVRHMDRDEQTGWQPEAVGPRYRAMEQAIIAFEADVTRLEGRFKLGQDETLPILREILERHADPGLVKWMHRANRDRLAD
ncbi:FMN-binding negative transcriptional regulator [Novosphingobium flavum]|uniref:FMN-binding negative transcriptional regulator n=1 Tax=Novosphingobium flavum TaxID=1778672 RepID=A0A7X1KLS5_9SPHN|nr:FMN-binding negative transcriptional regulator [Novosphingobium flavum]MBC2665535.1 FMN-binding negative transcriptional regulator [Novosphingobium flavum]